MRARGEFSNGGGNSLRKFVILVFFAVLALAPASQAALIVGSNDGGNCYPFSCGPGDGLTVYQEVYDANAFPGTLAFNQISFFQWQAGSIDTATYTISFSTTTKPVMGLDGSDYTANQGADEKLFGVFNLSGTMPAVLTFTGSTFNYNPSNGNLLMTVLISGASPLGGYNSFFQADYNGQATSRMWWPDGEISTNDTGALVTEFGTSGVPEPATYAMIGLGLAGLALFKRRK